MQAINHRLQGDKMGTNKVIKPRPYWHVDAKWLTGILLLILLNLTFLIYLLTQLTAPEAGISLLSTTLASQFSTESGGLDESGDIAILRQKIAAAPDGKYQPIPGLQITVTLEDIAGKTPREARLWFFRQMAEPLYYDGPEGLANLMTDPEKEQNLSGGVGPLGFINSDSHKKLLGAFVVSGLVSLFFLGFLVIFSFRYGRFGSPGCVIFLAAIPNLLLFTVARGWLEGISRDPASIGEPSILTRYTQLAADVLPTIVEKGIQLYISLVLFGISLLLIALVGSVFSRERKNKPDQEELH
jgi:hypothetical protein